MAPLDDADRDEIRALIDGAQARNADELQPITTKQLLTMASRGDADKALKYLDRIEKGESSLLVTEGGADD